MCNKLSKRNFINHRNRWAYSNYYQLFLLNLEALEAFLITSKSNEMWFSPSVNSSNSFKFLLVLCERVLLSTICESISMSPEKFIPNEDLSMSWQCSAKFSMSRQSSISLSASSWCCNKLSRICSTLHSWSSSKESFSFDSSRGGSNSHRFRP